MSSGSRSPGEDREAGGGEQMHPAAPGETAQQEHEPERESGRRSPKAPSRRHLARITAHEEMQKRRRAQRSSIEAVTLDVNQTLIRAPRLGQIYAEVLTRHGLEVEARALEPKIRTVWDELACRADPRRDRFSAHPRGSRGFWHDFAVRLCQHLGLGEPSAFATAELYGCFAQAEAWEIYSDVVPALEALAAAGLPLGVVSNWDERLEELLEDLGLARFFDTIAVSAEVGVEKPHPEIFRAALEALGAEPARALHAGDRKLEDVEGAQGLGMRAVRIDRRQNPRGLAEVVDLACGETLARGEKR